MADSDLTTRARAVLAGLSDAQRMGVGYAAGTEGHRPTIGTWDSLRRRLLVSPRHVHFGKSTKPDYVGPLTDLGREVARLLAEGGGEADGAPVIDDGELAMARSERGQ